MDYSQFHPVEQDEMKACVLPIIFKCFDSKPIGTDLVKMGFFKDSVLAVKVDGNIVTFALPFNGPISMLRDILTNTHYNKTDSIMVRCEVNDDNTLLTATFYSKEYKLFMDY